MPTLLQGQLLNQRKQLKNQNSQGGAYPKKLHKQRKAKNKQQQKSRRRNR